MRKDEERVENGYKPKPALSFFPLLSNGVSPGIYEGLLSGHLIRGVPKDSGGDGGLSRVPLWISSQRW